MYIYITLYVFSKFAALYKILDQWCKGFLNQVY